MQRTNNTQTTSYWPRAPAGLLRLFRSFPLVEHESQLVEGSGAPDEPTLWILGTGKARDEASYDVRSLSKQALMRFRGAAHETLTWNNEDGGPQGRLPALHLPDGSLLGDNAIQGWLDKEHPVSAPDESVQHEAAAWYALVETKLYPALLAHLYVEPLYETYTVPLYHSKAKAASSPPVAQLIHSLTAQAHASTQLSTVRAIVGASDVVEVEDLESEAIDALEALAGRLKDRGEGSSKWFLGTDSALPLDAALYAHLHALLALPSLKTESPRTSNRLRAAVERQSQLVEYARKLERDYFT